MSPAVGGSSVCKAGRALCLPRPVCGKALPQLALPPTLGCQGTSRVLPVRCHWDDAFGNLHVPRPRVGGCLFKNEVGALPLLCLEYDYMSTSIIRTNISSNWKGGNKEHCWAGRSSVFNTETGTGMEVQEPEQTQEKRRWYIFFFLDNRTGLAD